jgi:hypothetical protein
LGNIGAEVAENLISQLTELKWINSQALIENPNTNFTKKNKKGEILRTELEGN